MSSSLTSSELELASAKMEVVRKQAQRKFSRPGVTRGVSGNGGGGGSGTSILKKLSATALPSTDPRLLDYIYEVTFSSATAPPSQGLGGKEPSLDDIRGFIFSLPDFKAAAERVAYSEDLLTKAATLIEGATRCRLCGSNNTTSMTRQIHSSDEPPTTMLYCGSCHHRTIQGGE